MSDAYRTALASGSTALCRCFRLERLDGVVFGFTDHDGDVTFAGTIYRAQAALTATEAAASLGLAADELDASGALDDDAITEADLAAGAYDGATVEVWDVDWRDPAVRGMLGRYTIGRVERGSRAFTAELRSLTATLERLFGRMHTTLCDVIRLGDARCGLDLSTGGRRGSATIIRTAGTELVVDGLAGFASGAFDRGAIAWTTGANAGSRADIRLSRRSAGEVTLSLWQAPLYPPVIGDALTATVGCDRTATTCRNRFGNLLNFRGFPYMPGDTFTTTYAITGDPNLDGGSRFDQ